MRREVQRVISPIINSCFMWIDSRTALRWLHSIEKQLISVANYVTDSLELTTIDEWNQVPTGDNPADVGTRGLCHCSVGEQLVKRS